jgi:hypothetical protein
MRNICVFGDSHSAKGVKKREKTTTEEGKRVIFYGKKRSEKQISSENP